MTFFEIANRKIGPGLPPYVIAELSGNHNGEINRAFALIDAAKKAGADAIKLQTYTADTITINHNGPGFILEEGPWRGRSLYDLYLQAHTPWEWHSRLFAYARQVGLHCFSSPFDETAVDFLSQLQTPAFKIASFEIVDIPLIRAAASTGRPIIISTGMASTAEITTALAAAKQAGAAGVALLHCVSGYPVPAEEANCTRIPYLAARFESPVGLSDHTLGTDVAVVATALGACIIEKHLTLRRSDGGADAEFSLEPDEFARLVSGVRTAFASLGSEAEVIRPSEKSSAPLRRSVYVVAEMKMGDLFTAENVRSIRPGYGLAPALLPSVIGRKASCDLSRGTALRLEHVDGLDTVLTNGRSRN